MSYQNVVLSWFDEQLQKRCSWEHLRSSQAYKTWIAQIFIMEIDSRTNFNS